MARWLSEEWVREAAEDSGALPEVPGLDATIEMVVSGGPDGEVRWNWSYEGGRPGRGTPGAAPGATVSFTILEPDARALLAGELDPSVAFMRGRLKTAGDPGLVLALLEPNSDGGFQQWRRALAGRTTF